MLTAFRAIQNLASYKNFEWKSSVKTKTGASVKFKRVNILYGRNYAGKTTLSRIARGIEHGLFSSNYAGAKFDIEFSDGTSINEGNILGQNRFIRVFNDDFVKENLRFIADPSESITPFAILGDDNNRIEKELAEIALEYGSDEGETGKLGEWIRSRRQYNAAKLDLDAKKKRIADALYSKANKSEIGLKYNKLYGDPTYNVPKLERDLQYTRSSEYKPIQAADAEDLGILLREEKKLFINGRDTYIPQFGLIVAQAIAFATQKIAVAQPIQELINDAVLQEWVRKGRNLHAEREACGYCGSPIPMDLHNRLDQHFNKQSESLRDHLSNYKNTIYREIGRIDALLVAVDEGNFYSSFQKDVSLLNDDLMKVAKQYSQELLKVADLLESRINNIFVPLVVAKSFTDFSPEIQNVLARFEGLRIKCNHLTEELAQQQAIARNELRYFDVWSFAEQMKYWDEMAVIAKGEMKLEELNTACNSSEKQVAELNFRAANLKSQLRDESKGAEQVNFYLNNFFGHHGLSLRAIKFDEGYRFDVVRGENKAHHLSEGECSLIAFCYFMAKLKDIDTKNTKPIIWIDDPICSLDQNHIFFVFGLIDNEIVRPGDFTQLFISTHNLDFLKYLKRLQGRDDSGAQLERSYFLVERNQDGSKIKLMPGYLKNYISEFNYLFHQIFKCANADLENIDMNHDGFYNYANNCRKFLEAYLYYKYPNGSEKDEGKLAKFLGDDRLAASVIERINNEYSHLSGVFERSMTPIDIPEMKKTSQFILNRIKETDPDQYEAFVESLNFSD